MDRFCFKLRPEVPGGAGRCPEVPQGGPMTPRTRPRPRDLREKKKEKESETKRKARRNKKPDRKRKRTKKKEKQKRKDPPTLYIYKLPINRSMAATSNHIILKSSNINN